MTYVLISELRNYDLQTDVFLLIDLGYCAPIVLLLIYIYKKRRCKDYYLFHIFTE